MNQDSSLLFPHWIKPAGSLLIPLFHGSTFVNPVHPPPPHCTNYRNSWTINHPGTPVFTVSGPTSQQPPGLSTPLWRISPSNHWCPGSSLLHISTYC
ncbi:hypothetical protein AMECASPLE_035725 [Ameca splendens]|uniref:Uncharacterized protein n=1 Tax=Ameca splendens TaxID=208324 RepID=A0ABV1AF09_9TELE